MDQRERTAKGLLVGLLGLLLVTGCARNPDREDENMRIRDTTGIGDTVSAREDGSTWEDTVDRARRTVPDTAGDLDTTSRR